MPQANPFGATTVVPTPPPAPVETPSFTVQQNAVGKLRLVGADGTTVRLMAKLVDLQTDKQWRTRLEFRPSDFQEGKLYAILTESPYVDVVV